MNWPLHTRWAVAALIVLAYLALCAQIWWSRRRASAASAHTPHTARDWLVAYASQTGFAEQLARTTVQMLHTAGVPARLCVLADVTDAQLAQTARALFIVSTYGEGGPPDNGVAFARRVMTTSVASLSTLHFGVLMLGDAQYPRFCGFGHELTGWLKAHGAQALFDSIAVNASADTRAPLAAWQQRLSHLTGTQDAPDWEGPAWQPWRLAARRLLNPGSHGNPAFHLELRPPPGVTAVWESGDLVQVLALADPSRPRDYSIASIPTDGALHLLVRQERRPDGTMLLI